MSWVITGFILASTVMIRVRPHLRPLRPQARADRGHRAVHRGLRPGRGGRA
ncbi:hypothetical protein QJS66_21045 [Kocuria rhizophila]|nr:hypothetical protein QJS66_21045 [Kocuria rhizophila]